MGKFRTPDEYYDAYLEWKDRNASPRVFLRYSAALLAFLLFMILFLSAYWTYEDYSTLGITGVSWKNFSARADFRWHEFLEGRLGIN